MTPDEFECMTLEECREVRELVRSSGKNYRERKAFLASLGPVFTVQNGDRINLTLKPPAVKSKV